MIKKYGINLLVTVDEELQQYIKSILQQIERADLLYLKL
jgi:hypothetical protein